MSVGTWSRLAYGILFGVDSGCPRSGVLFDLSKQSKKAYKYVVRRAKQRQSHIASEKLGMALCNANISNFWKQVKAMKSSSPSTSPVVDGYTNDSDISNNFQAKLANLLNSDDPRRRNALLQEFSKRISPLDLEDTFVSECIVSESLGLDKSDGTGLSSNHFFVAASVLAAPLSDLFTAVLRHGYMPSAVHNCILVPIPKPHKDPTVSDSYRPIALAPILSKVLEKCILLRYRSCFITSDLQFGFKRGFSTELCSGIIKNVITKYLHNGTNVFGCFLDASKAFDRVNHSLLFDMLLKRNIPTAILRLLLSWYKEQTLSVRWNLSYSEPFNVTNGVRQGGVLSPILFTVYLDELHMLLRLSNLGIGCHFGNHFVGGVGYADDVALLAPSPSAMRGLLRECETFASEFGLIFNASKTQLIYFRRLRTRSFPPCGVFEFVGHPLSFSSIINFGAHSALHS